MTNEIEVQEIQTYELGNYLNQGYEFVCSTVHTYSTTQTITEDVYEPQINIYAGNGTNYNNNNNYNNIRQITKQIPVVNSETRILVKRTKAAKLLYEKSLNENRT